MEKIKIILMGTSEFAVPSFEKILQNDSLEVLSVFTSPDKKIARNQQIGQSPVKKMVRRFNKNIKIYQPKSFNDENIINIIKEQNPDLIFVISYGYILPKTVLEIPRFGCVNLHASLLPLLRGSSPIQSAILQGLNKTGITYFRLNVGIDDGDIIWKEEVPLTEAENAATLHDHLAELGGSVSTSVLKKYINLEIELEKQNNKEATYCSKLKRIDGEIIWASYSADEIERQIRAFNPWPGSFTYFQGKRMKVFGGEVSEERVHKLPGTVFLTSDSKIAVRAKNKCLILKEVQLDGKKRCGIDSFERGYSDFVGSVLGK